MEVPTGGDSPRPRPLRILDPRVRGCEARADGWIRCDTGADGESPDGRGRMTGAGPRIDGVPAIGRAVLLRAPSER